jgi:hypothetical protein
VKRVITHIQCRETVNFIALIRRRFFSTPYAKCIFFPPRFDREMATHIGSFRNVTGGLKGNCYPNSLALRVIGLLRWLSRKESVERSEKRELKAQPTRCAEETGFRVSHSLPLAVRTPSGPIGVLSLPAFASMTIPKNKNDSYRGRQIKCRWLFPTRCTWSGHGVHNQNSTLRVHS